MGASQGGFGGRLRLALLVAVAALFVLVPAGQAWAAEEFTLTVKVEGEGVVWCESVFEEEEESPVEEEKECGESNAVTETKYLAGTEVSLEPLLEPGYEFKEFQGDCSGETCDLTMDRDHAVTAVFVPEGNELAIEIVGIGKVECEFQTSSPEPCEEIYPEGAEVTLYALSEAGSEFAGWGGDCSGHDPCPLTMDKDHQVTATFIGGKRESGGGGSGGGSSNPPPVVSLPSPIVSGHGKAKVAGAGLYKSGKAMLRVSCVGGGACRGTVKLVAKLKIGHRTKSVTVGQAPFSLSAGASKPLTIKLSAPAKKLLGDGRTLTAKASGSGVTASTVKVKPTER